MSKEDTLQDVESGVAGDGERSRVGHHNRIRGVDEEEAVVQSDPMDYDYTNFYFGAGDDPFAMLEPFQDWYGQVRPRGYYQYELPIHSAPSTRSQMSSHPASRFVPFVLLAGAGAALAAWLVPVEQEAVREQSEMAGSVEHSVTERRTEQRRDHRVQHDGVEDEENARRYQVECGRLHRANSFSSLRAGSGFGSL